MTTKTKPATKMKPKAAKKSTAWKAPNPNASTLTMQITSALSKPLKDHRLQVQFDAEMFDWLQTESVRRRCSIAQIVRDLVLNEMIDG
jgi:hypothetical protein